MYAKKIVPTILRIYFSLRVLIRDKPFEVHILIDYFISIAEESCLRLHVYLSRKTTLDRNAVTNI